MYDHSTVKLEGMQCKERPTKPESANGAGLSLASLLKKSSKSAFFPKNLQWKSYM